MDLNFVLALSTALVGATAYIVTTAVFVSTTRADLKELKTDLKEFKNAVDNRFVESDHRLNTLEVDIAEIKAICRERSGKDSPV
jgi:ribosomal protein L29